MSENCRDNKYFVINLDIRSKEQQFPFKTAYITAMDETTVWASVVAASTVEKTEYSSQKGAPKF